MLQQTQVKTVIPYFNRFIARFPSVLCLANANEDEVLSLWSGLGYYSRARNLHKASKIICQKHGGIIPKDINELIELPGIGETTAAAISSLAFNQPTAILDGNVKRVLSRYFLIDDDSSAASIKKKLWLLAKKCMPSDQCAEYTQAIMDLGSTCCTPKNWNCFNCPLHKTCQAFHANEVKNYPKKPLKKIKPTKSQQFILMHIENNQLYLEKRPPKGIWGSLWCLPAIDDSLCTTQYIQKEFNFEAKNRQALLEMKHTFSHFHLNIKACSYEINSQLASQSNSMPGKWFTFEEVNQLGIAKPMQVIINHFFNEHQV